MTKVYVIKHQEENGSHTGRYGISVVENGIEISYTVYPNHIAACDAKNLFN